MRILFTRLFVGLLAGLILFSSSQWQPGPFSAAGILLVALGLTSAAAVGRLWCSLYIAGYKKSCLVTDGPYAMCRNPLYFFSMLGVWGILLFLSGGKQPTWREGRFIPLLLAGLGFLLGNLV